MRSRPGSSEKQRRCRDPGPRARGRVGPAAPAPRLGHRSDEDLPCSQARSKGTCPCRSTVNFVPVAGAGNADHRASLQDAAATPSDFPKQESEGKSSSSFTSAGTTGSKDSWRTLSGCGEDHLGRSAGAPEPPRTVLRVSEVATRSPPRGSQVFSSIFFLIFGLPGPQCRRRGRVFRVAVEVPRLAVGNLKGSYHSCKDKEPVPRFSHLRCATISHSPLAKAEDHDFQSPELKEIVF